MILNVNLIATRITRLTVGAQEAEIATDCTGASHGGGASKELMEVEVLEADEEAGKREREQVGAQKAMCIDGVAQGPVDAAGGSNPSRRDAVEDVGEHIVQRARQPVLPAPPTCAAFRGWSSSAAIVLPTAMIFGLESGNPRFF